ncbi:uncharacterized protein BO72DRAFT_463888 [Aspergillus fijiensis CBS 313.89]|uniref:Uncharacterized protein n=1 Tax=Aspergillus fijiensis CBS 313.89 TaxID=1448319 RepID=A0A8G1RJ30_9EURO|nr:uncharacterized protein BO72DRAFT_463888 [Aspergillus fijiensis CBS 313.89]RAK71346.1 hypothetical protein BO72DRAFT_463888 [Aspergillus fijiensis CBS 313.89]
MPGSVFAKSWVEFAPIATIIGSSNATPLVLGAKGPSGLAWAGMSVFGSLQVLKACSAAAIPDWLRQSIKLRDESTDSALGFRLLLDSTIGDASARRELGPTAVAMVYGAGDRCPRDVYALDAYTESLLRDVPECKQDKALTVCSFSDTRCSHEPRAKEELFWLAFSLAKLSELVVLCYLNALRLGLASIAPYTVFFLHAVVLHWRGRIREHCEDARSRGHVLDIIAGDLPTARKAGFGGRRVYLGIPQNFRRSTVWKVAWSLGALAYACSLPYGYSLLKKQKESVICIWTVFQVVWVLLRHAFSHFAKGADNPRCHPPNKESLDKLTIDGRKKLWHLVMGLARYQITFHPRGNYSYTEELQSYNVVVKSDIRRALPSDFENRSSIIITGILGDTLLAAAAWLKGSESNAMELYDCCVVSVKYNDDTISIPACRVLFNTSGKGEDVGDYEGNPSDIHRPKGGPNAGPKTVEWCYWFPLTTESEFSERDYARPGLNYLARVSVDQLINCLCGQTRKRYYATTALCQPRARMDLN